MWISTVALNANAHVHSILIVEFLADFTGDQDPTNNSKDHPPVPDTFFTFKVNRDVEVFLKL